MDAYNARKREAPIKTSLLSTLFVVQFLLVPSVFSADEKNENQYWTESGVSIEDVDFSRLDCYSTDINFRSCLAGINVLAKYALGAQVLPNGLLSDKEVPKGQKIKSIGSAASLVELSLEGEEQEFTLRQSTLRKKKISSKITLAEQQLYHLIAMSLQQSLSTNSQFINFASLSHELVAQIKSNPDLQDELSLISGRTRNAMVSVVDPHAYVLPIEFLKNKWASFDSSYFGVGLQTQMMKGYPVIAKLTEGGAAYQSKLINIDDILIKIEGQDIKNLSADKISSMIRGPEGSAVRLTLKRGNQEIEVQLLRKKVELKNVEVKVLTDLDSNKIGYIQLRSFSDKKACQRIATALGDLQKENVTGLILDLRNNPGGTLDQARCIAGLFVGDQPVLGLKDLSFGLDDESDPIFFKKTVSLTDLSEEDGQSHRFDENPGVQQTNLPLVTLIDAASASSSEILAGAFQDLKRGWVLGERSFGKATVQLIKEFPSVQRRLYEARTAQRFYQPSGRTNQIVGIQPDFEVPFKLGASEDERFALREGDIYPNALPPAGASWQQTRTSSVKHIQKCLSKNKQAEKKFLSLKQNPETAFTADYQLLMAQEVLACDMK